MIVLLRNLGREKLYAAINIAGLALGIACCLILGLFLRAELTYDRHFTKHDRIYRVVNEYTTGATSDTFAITSRQLGPMMAADYPQIKAFVRFQQNSNTGGTAIRHGEQLHYWKNTFFVDDNVFEIFNHDIIYGDPKTALKEGGSLAVSQKFARTYFGDENPIGKSMTMDSGNSSKIMLVFADLPANTHLKYDVLFSGNLSFLRGPDDQNLRRQQLFGVNNYTYLLMDPDFDPASWEQMQSEFFKRYMEDVGRSVNATWKSWLQKLPDIHLNSDVGYDQPTGNRIYLYGCAAVAVFILIVACINYMNLATARATRRARSVGIRKILGASRLSLGLRFLGEAIVFALIAMVLGIVIVEVALTFTPINDLMGGLVNFSLLEEPTLALWLLGVAVLIGVLSGLYPAFYLSHWAPLTALTGKEVAGKGSLRLREGLVLLQFTISAAVIACTLLMAAQMRYVANKSLGFEKENRLFVTLRGLPTIEKSQTIRTELGKHPGVLGVSEADIMLGQQGPINLSSVENMSGAMEPMQLSHMPIGDDFVQVMGLKLVEGRDFSKRLLTDIGMNFIVNQSFVTKMGWDTALGKRITIGPLSGRVIGVVEDFNFKSLHTLIEPLAMYGMRLDFSQVAPMNRPFLTRMLVFNLAGEGISDTLGEIEKVVREADPAHPFEYEFLDESLDKLYKSEQQLMALIGIFAVVCIFIACLGLFGLSAFATEQRTREIGTRKVLGATTMQIILMLARGIMMLVVVASVIASVLAYFAIDEWLAGFAYRAGINPLIFLISAAVAALVAFGTVAMQSYKTARADPVRALRHV